jgi:hypothetical protein
MTPWLRCADADIRKRAINRLWLCTSVLWAERNTVVQARNDGVTIPHDKTGRVMWLLESLDNASRGPFFNQAL